MQPTKELIDELRRSEIELARQRDPMEKMLAGAELFDVVCERLRWGIAMEMPDADEAVIEKVLRERVERWGG